MAAAAPASPAPLPVVSSSADPDVDLPPKDPSQQEHQHQQHPQQHPQLHAKPSTYASDTSTPSRTRSVASSVFTPLSTFPSSTSHAHAHAHEHAAAASGLDDDYHGSPLAHFAPAEAHVTAADHGDDGDGGGGGGGGDADHDGQDRDGGDGAQRARVPQMFPYAAPHIASGFLRSTPSLSQQQPLPLTHSLLASPSPFLCGRVRSKRRGGRAGGRQSASQSRNRSGRPSQEAEGGRPGADDHLDDMDGRGLDRGGERDGYGGGGDDDYDDDDDDEVASVDSHTLAWDQTCLRIAYLVNTMVAPSANGPTGLLSPAASSSTSALAPALGPATIPLSRDPADLLESFMQRCEKGWPGTDPTKKRRKVTQILLWQSEIRSFGDAVCCACAAGYPVPDDDSVSPAPTGLPAGAAGAAGEREATIDPPPAPCSECGCERVPCRPVVWVGDDADGCDRDLLRKVRRTQEGAGDSIRKVLKNVRGFLSLSKKRSMPLLRPAKTAPPSGLGGSTPAAAASPSPKKKKNGNACEAKARSSSVPTRRRAWDQWDEVNCERLYERLRHKSGGSSDGDDDGQSGAGDGDGDDGDDDGDADDADGADDADDDCADMQVFFPRTTMYRALTLASGELPPEMLVSPLSNEGGGGVYDFYGDNYDDDDDDEDRDDPEARARRRQREMAARLQRAQALLLQKHAAPTPTGPDGRPTTSWC